MSQWITEEQTPHLRLSAEAEEVLYSGESEFRKKLKYLNLKSMVQCSH